MSQNTCHRAVKHWAICLCVQQKRIGIRVLFYYTGNCALISDGISGTAEVMRKSHFRNVYTKYELTLIKSKMFWESLDI